MKRPLVAIALLYVAGILLAFLPVPLTQLFIVATALVLTFIAFPAARRIALFALLVLTGWINLAQRTAILSPNDLRTQFSEDTLASVRGVLLETPLHRSHQIKNQVVWTTRARLQTIAICTNGHTWHPATGQIMCNFSGYLPETYFAGQTVMLDGVIRRPRGPVAEGLFDYRKFLENQGIAFQFNTRQIADWHILASPAQPPLADRFCAWARKSLARGLPVEDENLQLEWALTLGWKAALTDELSDSFVKAATFHIFAVDGLRIAIVAGILFALFRTLNIPRAYCGLLAMPFLFFYAAMTGWPASAIRAIIMIVIIFSGWLLKRPSDLINSLFAAALIILVWEPRQLFQAGFQLSFFVVLCIILILPFFERLGQRVLRPDPLLPESLQPRWQKILRVPARWVVDLFLTSVAAWLGSIPLVAWYFHLLTPLSGPANVLAVPLCALVLICNLTSLLLTPLLPSIAVLYNHAGWFLMGCIRATSHWSAHWPGAYYYVPMPGLFTIALYYLILITVLTGWLFRGERRPWKISAAAASTLIWCSLWLWNQPITRLTVLPLEDGHAVFVNSAWARPDWLIDCGNRDAVDAVTKPYLQAQGVNRLDNFLLTHGEMNYSGGAFAINDVFQPRNIFVSSINYRSPDYREFQAATKSHLVWHASLQPGDHRIPWTVLYPPAQTPLTKAEAAPLVLRGEINGLRLLLVSNLSHAGQNALLATATNLQSDILISGLPEKDEPIDDALLNAVQPRAIILADNQRPASHPAGEKLRRRLHRRNIPIVYTSESEAATLAIRPHQWILTAMDDTEISGEILSGISPK